MTLPSKKNKPVVLTTNTDYDHENQDLGLGLKPKRKRYNYRSGGRYKQKDVNILQSHRAVFEEYQKQGFTNMRKAIVSSGAYSDSTSRSSGIITNTQSWKMLMDEYMPPDHLAKRHSELLDKRSYRKVEDSDGNVTEVDSGPDTTAVTKALDMGYKLRGSYNEKEVEKKGNVMYNFFYKPEVRKQMETFEDGLKQSLIHEINKKTVSEREDEEERARDNAIDV